MFRTNATVRGERGGHTGRVQNGRSPIITPVRARHLIVAILSRFVFPYQIAITAYSNEILLDVRHSKWSR